MALTTYTELKASIDDLLDISSVTSNIPDFITLAEAAIVNDKRTRFLLSEVRSQASLTAGSQYLALPTDFVSIRRMHIVASPQVNIEIVSRSVLNDRYSSSTGTPKYVAVTDGQFEFNRLADSAYTVEIIYNKFTALSTSNETNSIYPKYSDIYLYGSLIHAGIFLRDKELQAEARGVYELAVKKAKDADQASRYGGGLRSVNTVNAG